MRSFKETNWLLGENIDAFLSSTLSTLPNKADYFQVDSYYFSMISNEYHDDPKQRMKYSPSYQYFRSIEQLKLDIIIPIHKPQHWIGAVISYKQRTIFIKDSLYGNHGKIVTVLKKW